MTPTWSWRRRSSAAGELSATAAQEIADLPQTAVAVGLGTAPVRLGDNNEVVTVTDLAAIAGVLDVDVVAGELAGAAPSAVAISESWAERQGLAVGSTVDATFADGATETLTVAAVYADQQILGGFVLGQAVRAEHTAQPTDRAVFMTTRPRRLRRAGPPRPRPDRGRFGGDVQDRAEYTAAVTGGLDLLLSVVYALLALAIVIALLGIANTLSLAVHERRREIGLLRAVGQTRRHTRAALRLESVIVATFGTAHRPGAGHGARRGLVRRDERQRRRHRACPPAGDRRPARRAGRCAGRRAPGAPGRAPADPRRHRHDVTRSVLQIWPDRARSEGTVPVRRRAGEI